MKKSLKLSFLLVPVFLLSCAWVKLTPEGEKVRVLSMSEVESCKKLGKTTTSLKAKVAGMTRNEEKVQKEMNILARNSAVDMGGDTVVAVSEIKDGKQTFEVYKCVGPK